MALKTIYQYQKELAEMLYEVLPYPRYIKAARLIKAIVEWKEVELDDEADEEQ